MKSKKRIPTDGGPKSWGSPFAPLAHEARNNSGADLFSYRKQTPCCSAKEQSWPRGHPSPNGTSRREDSYGGDQLSEYRPDEKERLRREMQKACGAGGTIKEGRIEIQGDHRETVAQILTNAGFRPVLAGG